MNNIIDKDAAQAWADEKTSEDVFDVLAWVDGTTVPEDVVTIYVNAKLAYELNHLLEAEAAEGKAIKELEKSADSFSIGDDFDIYPDAEELAEREDRINDLQDELKASALHFHMKGLAPELQKAIDKNLRAKHEYVEGGANKAYNDAFNNEIIARSINYVVNGSGATDTTKWDTDRLAKLEEKLYSTEFAKLWVKAVEVNFSGDLFDNIVSADFS